MIKNDIPKEEVKALTVVDDLKLSFLDSCSGFLDESRFFNENEDFFHGLRDSFLENSPVFRPMLISFAREVAQKRLPYDFSYEEFDIPGIFISLLQSEKTDVFVTLFIIAGLSKNSPKYVDLLVRECAHKNIMNILINKENVSQNLVNQILALTALRWIVSSSEENRNKILSCANLGKIAFSVFTNFKRDDVIQCFFEYVYSLVSYKSIKKEYLLSIMKVLTNIKDLVGRNKIVIYLKCLNKISEYEMSGPLFQNNESLFSFIELSYGDLNVEIIRETIGIIANVIKNEGKLSPSIVNAALTYINCSDETVFQSACELCIQMLMHCLHVETIDLDIGVLVKRSMEGSRATKECALDLIIYYLMCRNDKIKEAIDNSLLPMIIHFIDGDDKECQIKVVELTKILMRYQDLTGINVIEEFLEMEGVDRLAEINEEIDDEELQESIEELIQTFYEKEESDGD